MHTSNGAEVEQLPVLLRYVLPMSMRGCASPRGGAAAGAHAEAAGEALRRGELLQPPGVRGARGVPARDERAHAPRRLRSAGRGMVPERGVRTHTYGLS